MLRSDLLLFFITLLINNLVEGSVPNLVMLAAATKKGPNTVKLDCLDNPMNSFQLRSRWIAGLQISVERNVSEQGQKPTLLLGIMLQCT